MIGDDRRGDPEWPIRPTETPVGDDVRPEGQTRRADTHVVDSRKRGLGPIAIALGGLLLLLLLLWLFAGSRGSDQDKLTGSESSNAAAAADPDKACASKQTYDLVKRELFRQAAQVRGSDQAAFDRLSAYAALRMQNPVMESEDRDSGRVNCSASLALDLPPGVAVVGGRRSLAADVDYTVQPAADGSGNVVELRNADGIITPLATLARVSPPPAATITDNGQQAAPGDLGAPVGTPPVIQPGPAAPQPAEPRETSSARPSFNCANARTRGERAVCGDSGLAALDRQMASQFNRAIGDADPGQRALLERTRGRFLAFRDRCGSDACIADAYRGRMREISDIMEGRWQPR